ncbi:MAG TPA: hypothetical protein VFC28_10855 [Opitutaceae bacterium]|jgi:hypothetical protein|nr:hypothetical protein [Opitutaceae bacterium]
MNFNDLLGKTQSALDEIFSAYAPGPIPQGNAEGEAIVWPGTFWTRLIARFVHDLAWQGKVFTPNPAGSGATLVNKLTPVGVQAVVARVYYTPSWLDGKQCIVLDYSKTSFLARKIRDEIRLIDPAGHLYLGKVWWGKTRLIDFALKFPA